MGTSESITPSEWPLYQRYTYPGAVRRGNLLFISGMTAADESGQIVGAGDITAQCDYIYKKMGEILRLAGASYDNVVMTTDYITTTDGYKGTGAVRRKYFTNGFPAATGVIVAGLLRPEALIEIEAVAVLD